MPMMQCGHAAQGYADNDPGKPVCVICAGLDPRAYLVAEEPDLKGRRARCAYFRTCGSEVDSSVDLAFFKYKGPGSRHAEEMCGNCAYHKDGHVLVRTNCEFVPRGPAEYDEYYCGCHGWN